MRTCKTRKPFPRRTAVESPVARGKKVVAERHDVGCCESDVLLRNVQQQPVDTILNDYSHDTVDAESYELCRLSLACIYILQMHVTHIVKMMLCKVKDCFEEYKIKVWFILFIVVYLLLN